MNLNELLGFTTEQVEETISLQEYLSNWSSDSALSSNAAGRLERAIGKPKLIDTAKDARLGRIFSNRTIRIYEVFSRFHGIEDSIDKVVQFIRFAAQGAEQSKQILYIYGPPGSGKSMFAEQLKALAEKEPAWVLGVKDQAGIVIKSPVLESPLGLFSEQAHGAVLEREFKIPSERLRSPMSRWAAEELRRNNGNFDQFVAVKVQPSLATRVCVARIDPSSDYDNQDLLVGSEMRTGDKAGYHYSGVLNCTTQGFLEFPEMFKVKKDFFMPLLSATQDRRYVGAGSIGELPYEGIIFAHSNEGEWEGFKKQNYIEGFLDRIVEIKFPYNVRVTEEQVIYRQYLAESGYGSIPMTQGALEIPARFAVSSRLVSDTAFDIKKRLYDGQAPAESALGKSAKSADEFRKDAKEREGMAGLSPRQIFTLLPVAASADPAETGLDPFTIYETLDTACRSGKWPDFPNKMTQQETLKKECFARLQEIAEHEIEAAFVENHDAYLRTRMEEYSTYVDHWCEDTNFKDPATDTLHGREWLDQQMAVFEKGMNIKPTLKVFRFLLQEKFLRFKSKSENANKPLWEAIDESIWRSFEKNISPTREDMLSVISFERKRDAKETEDHEAFVARMCSRGYTRRQARRLVEWYIKNVS